MALPNIFKPNINKTINNNKEVYYSFLNNTKKNSDLSYNESPLDTLDRLETSGSYIFNKKVTIITKNKTYNTKIAGKLKNYLITLDNDKILLSDIISIKEQ